MGTAPGSLASAIAKTDGQLTVLDDRIDAEDHAEWLWLRAHVLHGFLGHRVVLGTESLTAAWQARTTKFASQDAAAAYLRHFTKNHTAMVALRRLAAEAGTGAKLPRSDEEVITALAANLLQGRTWLIDLPKAAPKSRFATKTSPDAFAPINPKYGTNVDFAYIAKLEGDQMLRGYIPYKGKTDIAAGQSGMTIASGFDLGQWRQRELKALGFDPKLLAKLLPFAYPLRFKRMSKPEIAALVGKTAPVPEIGKPDADLCDRAVFTKKLGDAMDQWNDNRGPGIPKFTDLPGGWQTVWLSRIYQGKLGSFGDLALSGQWQSAIISLRAGGEYAGRTNQEADLLARELPAAVKSQGANGTK